MGRLRRQRLAGQKVVEPELEVAFLQQFIGRRHLVALGVKIDHCRDMGKAVLLKFAASVRLIDAEPDDIYPAIVFLL